MHRFGIVCRVLAYFPENKCKRTQDLTYDYKRALAHIRAFIFTWDVDAESKFTSCFGYFSWLFVYTVHVCNYKHAVADEREAVDNGGKSCIRGYIVCTCTCTCVHVHVRNLLVCVCTLPR